GRWFSLGVLKVGAETRERWMQKATLPAPAVLGFLVGICEFPCTGGVYVGILGLLSAQTTYFEGLGYLLMYNVMFVLPLVAILLALGNRRTLGQVSRWEAQHKQALKLGQGLVMIALGVAILLWFV
ncbi:MAG: cytochrome c biogenesis protein CcdA, partial [Candidatus Bipolaricaulia bacterium]